MESKRALMYILGIGGWWGLYIKRRHFKRIVHRLLDLKFPTYNTTLLLISRYSLKRDLLALHTAL